MSLSEYTRKRDFSKTGEPAGRESTPPASQSRARFVVQKHDARRLHYDLRLEHNGALLSWAVPKGPSLDPDDKRLAVKVEDHPLDYASFEGTIPKGEYGGGTVLVWDAGEWTPKSDVEEGLKKGRLSFTLRGEKLRGSWSLARMRGKSDEDKDNWLLIKSDDDYAASGDGDILVRERGESVISGRDLEAVAKGLQSRAKANPEKLPNARKRGKMPTSLKPQLATLADSAPEGEDWIHEIKYDGYRLLAFCQKGSVTLKTRNDKDWTSKFPSIQKAFEKLALDDCIVDGEVIATEADGISNFQGLQNALKQKKSKFTLRYMAFDLPFAGGCDLQETPLVERKRLLQSLVTSSDTGEIIRYSDQVVGEGDTVFKNACKLGLEGIISKKSSSPYANKRSRYWLKVKCEHRQEFVICGFTEPAGSRAGFGALHLAYYEKDQLRYAGKVGTGFDDKTLKRLRKELDAIASDTCPLKDIPADAGGTTWVKPEKVAEVKYAEQTQDGLLRHAAFEGLREDKPARSVHWEAPQPAPEEPEKAEAKPAPAKKKAKKSAPKKKTQSKGKDESASHKLTNPDRVLYPKAGITKETVADYYESVASWMLPYVEKRPLALLRHPRGWTEKGFFQKHVDESFPEAIKHVEIAEGDSKSIYGYVDSSEGLVGLLQMGTLEIHAWGSRIDNVEQPDIIVMDLDPDEGLASEAVVGAAVLLRDLLEEKAGLKSFLKTTGGKGLHVVIPIRRGPSWQEVKEFSKAIAEALKQRNPQAFTTTSSKQKRKGKIYIDYLRNGRGATAIAPFSTRAREGAPVAVPLAWDEALPALKSNYYTVSNVMRRLSQLKRDPWEEFGKTRQGLSKSARKAFGLS